MMDYTNITNGVGIIAGTIVATGSDRATAAIGLICAIICAVGYLLKVAAKIACWCLSLKRKIKNGATIEELEAHFGELEKLGEEIEKDGKNDTQ